VEEPLAMGGPRGALKLLLITVFSGVVCGAVRVSVVDFGAKGDGTTDDTAAFVGAIGAVSAAGGGSVLVPAPGRYLLAPVNLTSHLELHLVGGATLQAVQDKGAWPVIPGAPSYGQGRDNGAHSPRYTSLLHGEHLTNVTVRGDGARSVVDGGGAYWWAQRETLGITRGHLIEFMYCTRVRVADLRMVDSPFWNNHFFDCDDVHVRGVSIEAPDDSPNTDGWDPDSSRNVLIEDSTYVGGDDCVAIKSGWDCYGVAYAKPCVNITVRNITCSGRYAGVAIGSEMSGGVENVTVENCTFDGPARQSAGPHIKTGQSRGGYVQNAIFRDIVVSGGLIAGILVDSGYGAPNPSCPAGWAPPAPPRMANYSFERIDGSSATWAKDKKGRAGSPFHFVGSNASFVSGVALRDVRFATNPAVTQGQWVCAMVSGTAANGTVFPWPPCPQIHTE
jgi:polygalacturonase